MDYAPRKRINREQLCELLVGDNTIPVQINGVDVEPGWLHEQLTQTAEMVEQAQAKKLMPRPTVDEPAYHEGSRNQRRVQKKLMRKATKAGKRR